MTVRNALDQVLFSPVREVSFHALLADAQLAGRLDGLGCSEGIRQGFQQLALPVAPLGRRPVELMAGEFFVHVGGMPDKHPGNGHRGAEVFVLAVEGRRVVGRIGLPEHGQDHRNPEGDEAQPPDACYDVIPEVLVAVQLSFSKVVVELLFLGRREAEADAFAFLQALVQSHHSAAYPVKGGFQVLAVLVLLEHVQPFELEVHAVENEAGEESVLCVRYQRGNLPGCAGKDGGQFRLHQLHELPVLAPGVGYRLMVECFPESVAVVAVVGSKDVGQGIALRLEHQAAAVILGKDLSFPKKS